MSAEPASSLDAKAEDPADETGASAADSNDSGASAADSNDSGASATDSNGAGLATAGSGHGLTPPSLTGAGRRFLSDLIVELGFVGSGHGRRGRGESAQARNDGRESAACTGCADRGRARARARGALPGLDRIDLTAYDVDRYHRRRACSRRSSAKRYRAVPVGTAETARCWWRSPEPRPVCAFSLGGIAVMTDCAVRPAVAARSPINKLIEDLDFMEGPTDGDASDPRDRDRAAVRGERRARGGACARGHELGPTTGAPCHGVEELEAALTTERRRLTAELDALHDGHQRALDAERERHG